ncbi:hypothetical protein HZ326_14876 [Fusarium oxysporum f. sp. albedinis]|nr:hypothetical protein HZ326_14876 [Fusarium oxysporum f. sp. albedinis]
MAVKKLPCLRAYVCVCVLGHEFREQYDDSCKHHALSMIHRVKSVSSERVTKHLVYTLGADQRGSNLVGETMGQWKYVCTYVSCFCFYH